MLLICRMDAGCVVGGGAAECVDGLACLEEAHNLGCRAAQLIRVVLQC